MTPEHHPQGCLGHTLEPPGSPADSVKSTTLHTQNPLTLCAPLTTSPSDPGPELEIYLPFTGQELPQRRIPPGSSLAQACFHRCPGSSILSALCFPGAQSQATSSPSPHPITSTPHRTPSCPQSACGGRAWRLCAEDLPGDKVGVSSNSLGS